MTTEPVTCTEPRKLRAKGTVREVQCGAIVREGTADVETRQLQLLEDLFGEHIPYRNTTWNATEYTVEYIQI